MTFYRCAKCGKIVELIKPSKCPTFCCNEEMKELVPGTSDGASEKHVPVIDVEGNTARVTVGSVIHPMLEEHYIEWIILETDRGVQKKLLSPGQEPAAEFVLADGEKAVSAYEYCNLHRLWKFSV